MELLELLRLMELLELSPLMELAPDGMLSVSDKSMKDEHMEVGESICMRDSNIYVFQREVRCIWVATYQNWCVKHFLAVRFAGQLRVAAQLRARQELRAQGGQLQDSSL